MARRSGDVGLHEPFYDSSADPNYGRKGLKPVYRCRRCGTDATMGAFEVLECLNREQQVAAAVEAAEVDAERAERAEAERAEARKRNARINRKARTRARKMVRS